MFVGFILLIVVVVEVRDGSPYGVEGVGWMQLARPRVSCQEGTGYLWIEAALDLRWAVRI